MDKTPTPFVNIVGNELNGMRNGRNDGRFERILRDGIGNNSQDQDCQDPPGNGFRPTSFFTL
jgi:hypothetical protein